MRITDTIYYANEKEDLYLFSSGKYLYHQKDWKKYEENISFGIYETNDSSLIFNSYYQDSLAPVMDVKYSQLKSNSNTIQIKFYDEYEKPILSFIDYVLINDTLSVLVDNAWKGIENFNIRTIQYYSKKGSVLSEKIVVPPNNFRKIEIYLNVLQEYILSEENNGQKFNYLTNLKLRISNNIIIDSNNTWLMNNLPHKGDTVIKLEKSNFIQFLSIDKLNWLSR